MAKKNIRKIPKLILRQLEHLKDERYIVVACLRVYSSHDLLGKSALKHLNVHLGSNELSMPEDSVLPPESSGKHSFRNINGHEVIRKDLPKETHYNDVESPNWGDSYNGTHTVRLPYERYPRDFNAPRYRRIKIEAKDVTPNLEKYILTFQVDHVLDRESQTFEADMLECLNILQENIGVCGVQKSGAMLSDYLKTVNLAWEVLPPGTKEDAIERIFANHKSVSEGDKNTAGERYGFFMKLSPQKLIYGTSGLQRYFGALLEDDLVVFENVEYGNAVYVMFSDWVEMSKRTRTELLSGQYGKNFERIPHMTGWKNTVQNLVKMHRVSKSS